MASISVRKVGAKRKSPRMQQVIDGVMFQEAREIKKDYERTTRTWKTKVTFVIKKESDFRYLVSTSNRIYGYVDQGTRAHPIYPRRAKALRFNTRGFRAKTSPNTLVAYAGSPAKPPTAFRKKVNHPGFKGRFFTKRLAEKSRKRFAKKLQNAIAKALRSG